MDRLKYLSLAQSRWHLWLLAAQDGGRMSIDEQACGESREARREGRSEARRERWGEHGGDARSGAGRLAPLATVM